MRMTYYSNERTVLDFAKRAAEHFAKCPEHNSFSDGDLKAGELLALRWGLSNDCVLVMRIDPDFEPANFQQLVKTVSAVQEEAKA